MRAENLGGRLLGSTDLNGGMADSGHDNQDHAAGTEAPLGDFAFRLESCLHLFAFFLDKKFAAKDERAPLFSDHAA